MANENDKNPARSYTFLVDTKNSRQYVIQYDESGNPIKGGLLQFAVDARHEKSKPGETFFAMDDAPEFETLPNGTTTVTTTIYQFTHTGSDRTGDHFDTKAEEVTYELVARNNTVAGLSFDYTLPEETRLELLDAGFKPEFLAPIRGLLPKGTAVETLSFPPNHPGGALVARTEVAKLPAPRPSVKEPFNTVTPQPPKKYKVPDATIDGIIKQYCRDFSLEAAEGRLDPVVGRDKEIDQALKIMTRRKQSSLCFTGDAGVGKTAMFAGIAQRLNDDDNLPESLENCRVLELNLASMNAGTKYRGEFEARIQPLIEGLQEREGILKGRKIILAIDELHSQLTAGKAEGGTDAGNMMKGFMASKGVSVMATTTDDEYKKHIEKDSALASRFEKMRLDPPNTEATTAIIKKLWPLTKEHNHLETDLTDEEIKYIVTMTDRYNPSEFQPRKTEKVMNMAAASAEFDHRTAISKSDIIAAVAQMSHLAPEFLNQSDHDRFLKMETELPKEVLGQPGLQRLVDGLIGSRSGLTDPNQPWGCFVFQGPTGTGKTETAKALSRYLFGTEEALIKLDMSEYSEKHTVSRLIGAPPGYVGFDSAEPALTERIRQQPYSILVLDEIEKAHPDVFNIFLTILNDGKMTDNQGKTVLFNNVIILMTTNLGAAEATAVLGGKTKIGLGGKDDKSVEKTGEELAAIYKKARTVAAGGPFRPEMVNRVEELGGFVTFLPLTQEVINNLAARELGKVSQRLEAADGRNLPGAKLEVTQEVMEQLYVEGYNPAMGARPLRKVIREKISNPLGKWLMDEANAAKVKELASQPGGVKIVVGSLEGPFEPKLVKGEVAVANDNTAEAPAKKKAAARPARKKVAAPEA